MASKARLDSEMVLRGLAESREKAQGVILAGQVFVKGLRANKPSHPVDASDAIEVRGAPHPYVSRGGLKLEKAIDVFDLNPQGLVCVDAGASTGGFTDVLLRAGAEKVYAVDVGYGQLDWKLRSDPRVAVMERTNARYLTPEAFDPVPTLFVMDVSFISIQLILPALFAIVGPEGRGITLVKPQFEAGRDKVGKNGVVRDPATHLEVLRRIHTFVAGTGWRVSNAAHSPITGPEGNIEFLFDLMPPGSPGEGIHIDALAQIVLEAHKQF